MCRHFGWYTNHDATFGLLYIFLKLQEMSEDTLKCHCINLYLKLNSDLHRTELYEELNLFRKIILQELWALDGLTFLFWKDLSEMHPSVVTVHKILLTVPVAVTSSERSFSR